MFDVMKFRDQRRNVLKRQDTNGTGENALWHFWTYILLLSSTRDIILHFYTPCHYHPSPDGYVDARPRRDKVALSVALSLQHQTHTTFTYQQVPEPTSTPCAQLTILDSLPHYAHIYLKTLHYSRPPISSVCQTCCDRHPTSDQYSRRCTIRNKSSVGRLEGSG